MENRFWVFLLSFVISGCSSLPWFGDEPASPPAQEAKPQQETSQTETVQKEIIQQDPVIQPAVKRREVSQDDIDTENFELGLFFGVISIEDFGSNAVYGIRLDYHISEDFFIEGAIDMSKGGKSSAETFTGSNILTDDQRDYYYYTVGFGYNLLPGEAFIGRNKAFNTALYLYAGAGATEFAGDSRFTITWGAGYRIVTTDWLAVHMDFRDHIYAIDVTGEDKNVNNFEATLGLTFFF